ncbi:MAG: hypothetical protein ACSHW0_18025 [Thalassotalea sp.]
MNNKRVYISGYWKINSNVKKSVGVYFYGIEKTFQLIKHATLYFFTDSEEVIPFVIKCAEKNNINLKIIHRSLASLPANKYVTNVIKSAEAVQFSQSLNLEQFDYRNSQEKGFIHYFRDLKHSGRDNYQNLLLIWLSKIFLVNEIINSTEQENQKEILYCWLDCTAERFSYTRQNWCFAKTNIPNNRLGHYSGSLFYMGVKLPISASFMSGGNLIWKNIETLFINELECATNTAYAHDEETLITNIIYKHPDLFHLIGADLISYYANKLNKNWKLAFKKYVYYRNRLHSWLSK